MRFFCFLTMRTESSPSTKAWQYFLLGATLVYTLPDCLSVPNRLSIASNWASEMISPCWIGSITKGSELGPSGVNCFC